MASRQKGFSLNYTALENIATQLEKLGADLGETIASGFEAAAETVEEDTVKAMEVSNLPRGGRYSRGQTAESIIHNAKAEIKGSIVEIGIGFDKTKPGAGGFLITGTPKMRPDYELERIYGTKKYQSTFKKEVENKLKEELDKRLGG